MNAEEKARIIHLNLMACLAEKDRLASLTNEELVQECAGNDVADYEIVIELMNRVSPGWENR